jgi:hypothetical protein
MLITQVTNIAQTEFSDTKQGIENSFFKISRPKPFDYQLYQLNLETGEKI